jgi:hypothetical protein
MRRYYERGSEIKAAADEVSISNREGERLKGE